MHIVPVPPCLMTLFPSRALLATVFVFQSWEPASRSHMCFLPFASCRRRCSLPLLRPMSGTVGKCAFETAGSETSGDMLHGPRGG
ncbi:hypothetical protein LZ30DRAFT_710028 [Colletotrichum cereale]|nr:hypothetical protein LZ30DRAFT_710028 [Colletotrichum cereale]